MKKLIPERVKRFLKLAYDFFLWIQYFKRIPFVIENQFGIKLLIYPWQKQTLPTLISAHDLVKEFAAYKRLLTPRSVVFDVGANVGATSIYLATLTDKEGCVHAFEPIQRTMQLLKENVALNRKTNIVLHPMALADKTGTQAMFKFDESEHHLSSLGKVVIGGNSPEHTEEVTVTTIDAFCKENNITEIHLLKIDVEGFEDAVLEGATNMLTAGTVKYIQFEISKMPLISIGKSSQGIFSILHRHQYKIYRYNLELDRFEGPIDQEDNDFDNYYASREDLSKLPSPTNNT